ncbi:MAG: hypothetical protein M3436_13575 [Pseudomonadota bacterium]|nr:hypothetical protein [Pseudomonadota bacterium]
MPRLNPQSYPRRDGRSLAQDIDDRTTPTLADPHEDIDKEIPKDKPAERPPRRAPARF